MHALSNNVVAYCIGEDVISLFNLCLILFAHLNKYNMIKLKTCSTISNISYNLMFTTKFNDYSILITIISCDHLNLSLADEHVDGVTVPTQVIEYNQHFLQAD